MRVTRKTLESLVQTINKITESPATPYTKTGSGIEANIGNYYLYECLGCIELHRICNTGGGVNTVFFGATKRELEMQLRAFIAGFSLNKVA